ncbi:hypothetical protein [Tunicatimonas pelagia]|uniref:hypothetical protein n=1 Tax=Tunicatimonas pelagia TaxID=931531 RepID=UPI002665C1B4|nr:hypothetical protein [Tunicatimonas pelagia]WKN41288.1 hypothetical protein P0M28_19830 [Tunicatimonas pelagia]
MAVKEAEADPIEVAAVQERLASLANRMQQVNITFLVDATEGMEEHLPAVAQAAATIEENYQAEIEAACYRDAAEGAWLYMTNSMVGDAPASWIQSLDTKSKFDQDEPEALYYGLKRTLESSHLTPNETNILVLVGDAGNHAQEPTTDVSPTDIVQLLKAKDCHFAVFQARNLTSSSSYADFSSQMRGDIFIPLKNSLEASTLQEKDRADQYGIHYAVEGSTSLSLYSTNPAQSLPANVLSEKIIQFVAQVLAPNQYAATIEALSQGEDVVVEPQLAEFLRQNQFTAKEIEVISSY